MPPRAQEWWKQIQEWKEEHPLVAEKSDSEIKPQHLDGGNRSPLRWPRHCHQRRRPASDVVRADYSFQRTAPLDQLRRPGLHGLRPPSAIGAQFARPDKLVFSIVGDGGFQMSIPELATIVNQSLPIKIIIMNNGYLGMVRQWQELFYNNRLSEVNSTSFPDVEKLAGAYGFKGRTVSTVAELPGALKAAVDEPGPFLLNVKVSPFENVFPMVPAGGAINEMVLRPPQPVEV